MTPHSLMPMIIRNLHNDRYKHDKSDRPVVFQNGQEKVVLEETHRPVRNLG